MTPERQVSVAEALPFSKGYGRRKFFLANEQERQELKTQFPELAFRVATAQELSDLQGKTWEVMEQEDISNLLAQEGVKRV